MWFSSLSQLCILSTIIIVLINQYIFIVQAGNCFFQRTNDLCYGLSEADTNEELCSGSYYSDSDIKELDGFAYAENCRPVNVLPKLCDFNCGLGQQCQLINNEEMCVCSEASCTSSDSLSSKIEQHPLCASNNMTFSSECAMEAWKCFNQQSALYKKYDGECQKDCQNVRCPSHKVCLLVQNTGEPICYPKNHCNSTLNPEPVCDTNGITYPNICVMRLSSNRQGQTPVLAHKGSCENECRPDLCEANERCVYSKQFRPVCIRCQYSSTFLKHSGECTMNIPICGDDQNLYENYCSLLFAQCYKNQYINITGYGACPTKKRKNINRNKFKYLNRFSKLKVN
ncbi:unnamed protein product [Rotaria sordida]|uniref:Kazal-like domain-containing protein n=1 Tax=Rotaria sordida TaxID=392033 RepID=A0A814CZ60_9BILA|nr:unnamed protein product [Rotaria sordida]CAF1167773.1 unnamed protein product [Rotaria sordida]